VIVVAANSYRGRRGPRTRVAALVRALEALGLPVRVVWDQAERGTTLRSPAALRSVRCVVAAGGDGTVSAVINELSADVPLAVLPLGNENLFAGAFGFEDDPGALAGAIARGTRQRIDLGRAHTTAGRRLFTLMLSAGFDADVVHRFTRWRTAGGAPRRAGRAAYVRPLAAALWSYPHAAITLTADGVAVDGSHCTVANLPDYALDMRLAPEARADDGLLDWTVLSRSGRVALAGYALAVARARHTQQAHVPVGRARKLTLRSAGPVPVQIDGDPWGFTPVEVEVMPAALSVVVI
jgi:diacylglycerol kinase family enzyme